VISVAEAASALRQARVFLSDLTRPPGSHDEQRRLISTLHALDHASRLAETAGGGVDFEAVRGGQDDVRAGELCADAMRNAASVAGEVAVLPGISESPQPTPASRGVPIGAAAVPTEKALAKLERCAMELGELRRTHRVATLGAVAHGTLPAEAAIVRVETLRSLEAMAHDAWRSSAHLVGRGE
jgi:phosphate:Na+ symporter